METYHRVRGLVPLLNKGLVVTALALAASTLAFGPQAVSAGNTMTLTVTASIVNTCSFTSPSATIPFGAYDPIVANASTDITSSFSPSYTCTSGDSGYTWAFASGNLSGSACRMTDGSNHFLTYTISDGTNSYCAGTAHAAASEVTATGSAQTYNHFTFTLTRGQATNTPAGSYSDTNTLTIAP